MKKFCITLSILLASSIMAHAQYISEVLEYKPAPGQQTNSSPWGVPQAAKSLVGTVTGSMSLGAFGGYVIFKFGKPVENNPDNPFGVDFTVFGNPLVNWSEPGVVWVMKDENGNGLPDDTWYELAGSDYYFSSTIKNYEVTYTNLKQSIAANVPWSDNRGKTGFVSANSFHTQPYYPLADSFPSVGTENYTLKGTFIAGAVDSTANTNIKSYKRAFGYADNLFRGSAPYTVPDNPYTLQKENSGGDALDIDWAVDANGNYINLDKIDFVKVQNGMLANGSWLGEVSTEVTGAVAVTPDKSITGVEDMIVIKDVPKQIDTSKYQLEVFVFHKGRLQPGKTINWSTNVAEAAVDANNVLTLTKTSDVIVTATLAENANIRAIITSKVVVKEITTAIPSQSAKPYIRLYPNPATEYIKIGGVSEVAVSIFNISGKMIFSHEQYAEGQTINISDWAKGIYILQIKGKTSVSFLKFTKK